jgi:hypothetical protein
MDFLIEQSKGFSIAASDAMHSLSTIAITVGALAFFAGILRVVVIASQMKRERVAEIAEGHRPYFA